MLTQTSLVLRFAVVEAALELFKTLLIESGVIKGLDGCSAKTLCEQSNPESRTATAVCSPLYSTFDELKIPVS